MNPAQSSRLPNGLKYVFVRVDPTGLRARNKFAPERSKFRDPQVALQRLARKIAFGNTECGALALKGPIQIIRYT
jgi:hypothetical protein